MLPDWKEQGATVIVVTRLHPKGTISYATYMVDTWCRGLVNSAYKFNVSPEDFQEDIDYMNDMYPEEFEKVDYSLVHNIIYGAIEFAGEVELMPHSDWALTRYFLMDDDDDDAPFIEMEFGRDGKYVLCVADKIEQSRCKSKLDRILGPGNYEYIVSEEDDDYIDDYVDDFNLPDIGKEGVYAYQHPQYPSKEALSKLHFPHLVDTLNSPIEDMDDAKLDEVMALPHDELSDDLELIIRVALGADWKAIENNKWKDAKYDYHLITTSLLLLGAIGDPSRLDTVLEVARQSEEAYDFYFGDYAEWFIDMVVYQLAKDNLESIFNFMIEPGLYPYMRLRVLQGLTDGIMEHEPERREEVLELLRRVLQYLLDNCEDDKIWDGSLVALLMGSLETLQAVELEPLVRDLYATGYVDEHVYGDIEETLHAIKIGDRKPEILPLDLHEWLRAYRASINK